MPNSPLTKLQVYGGQPINKAANSILSKKRIPKKLSKRARHKLYEMDLLKVRRCAVCRVTYRGTLVDHKLSTDHKKNKLKDMLEIKR